MNCQNGLCSDEARVSVKVLGDTYIHSTFSLDAKLGCASRYLCQGHFTELRDVFLSIVPPVPMTAKAL